MSRLTYLPKVALLTLLVGSPLVAEIAAPRPLQAQLDPGVCFAVASTQGTLVSVNETTGAEGTIGLTTAGIEAMALPPSGSILYAADGDQLGTLDLTAGGFAPALGTFGAGNGVDGTITFDDVKGLAFEPSTGLLYGSHRRAGADDGLIVINPVTGAAVANAFGAGTDYVVMSGCQEDIEDLAIDPGDGRLYAIANTAASGAELVTIDKANGTCTSVGFLLDSMSNGIDDMAGLSFDALGQLHGTTGAAAGANANKLWLIDKSTATATEVGMLGLDDYRALACPLGGCELQFRLRHLGVGIPGGTVKYQLFWLNPCQSDAPGIVITDTLPSELQVLTVSANAPVQVSGNTVTIGGTTLPKGAATATVTARVATDVPAGSAVENHATLVDAFGRQATATDSLDVRSNVRSGLFLTLAAPANARPGQIVTFGASIRNAAPGSNQLTLSLPAGVTVLSAFPSPSTNAAGVLTWQNLRAPAAAVRVKTRVDDHVPVPNILTATAIFTDGSGRTAISSHDTLVGVVSGVTPSALGVPSLSLTAPKTVRPGLVAQITIGYRRLSGSGTLTVVLPVEIQTLLTIPAAALGADGQLTWSLPGPSGSVKIRGQVSASAAPGSVLPITASLVDGHGTASQTQTITVRE